MGREEEAPWQLRDAVRAEEKAYQAERNLGFSGRRQGSKEVFKKFMKAGGEYRKVGDFGRAGSNFSDALKYAPQGSRRKRNVERLIQKMEIQEKVLRPYRTPYAVASVISFAFALVFITFSFTGFAVFNMTDVGSQWAGFCFFVCGVVFALLYFREKKKPVKKKPVKKKVARKKKK